MKEYPDFIVGRLRVAQDGSTYVLIKDNGEPIYINEWFAQQEVAYEAMDKDITRGIKVKIQMVLYDGVA